MKGKHPAGPPMTLGNMRDLGVHRLVASCLNDASCHTALIDVSNYPADTVHPAASLGGRGLQRFISLLLKAACQAARCLRASASWARISASWARSVAMISS